jgi:hypothetical protein
MELEAKIRKEMVAISADARRLQESYKNDGPRDHAAEAQGILGTLSAIERLLDNKEQY